MDRAVIEGGAPLGRRPRAVIVVDLGFGDAGKGVVTDALVRNLGARAVVRFNGGAQAGHNVVTPDGRHHTFAQLGAGTFVPGVRTHFSSHTVVHPTALRVEADRLARVGVHDALARFSVSPRAKVVTPYHQAANRIRERARGAARHGSCGVGIGEVMRDALAAPEDVIEVRHLYDVRALRRLLERARERLRAEVEPLGRFEESSLFDDGATDFIGRLPAMRMIEDDAFTASIAGPVVFEGAQGVLLDEWRGFHPYTTWSTCTFDNALEIARGCEVQRIGVLRTYATRHGPGPFPTERTLPVIERHNGHGAWQGGFRVGDLDIALLRYAIAACGGVDGLAVTHLDALPALSPWRVCVAHRPDDRDGHLFSDGRPIVGRFRDLEHQSALTEALFRVTPVLTEPSGHPMRWLEAALGTPVVMTANGPTFRDMATVRKQRARFWAASV